MTLSLAQNAIAFLIDLAEKGEIDPWDVKVIEVIDRFLSSLPSLPKVDNDSGRSPYEASLSESGQAFLYASMLVLLKADTLVRSEADDEEAALEAEEFIDEGELDPAAKLPRNLERHLHRRAVASPPRKRQVTLKELIKQLELIAAVMAEHKPRIRARSPRPQGRRQAVRAIAQLAHQENLSEIAAALEAFLNDYWDQLGEALDWIDFESLLELWPKFRPAALGDHGNTSCPDQQDKHERVGVFWGLLFLSAQSKVELSQEEFYQDLKVRNLNEMSMSDASEIPSFVLPD
ncbi:MAG: ScpA family protein [Leptolyngbyaceae cyanobacterium MO_188.B28]|nr:ScpA family protein [Leptolyngbyaceae cyanobacterium MO_188.B28]